MAETCSAVIARAFRKLGVLRAGAEPSTADAAEGVASLKSFYMEGITGGGLGRVYNAVASAAGDLTAEGMQHFNITTEDAVTVDLPSTVPWGYWWNWRPYRDYGWGLYVPLGGDSSVTTPTDRAVVMITSEFNDDRASYIYDGTVQRWMRVDNIELTDEAPLSARDADGLSSLLAVRLADQYGDTSLSALTLRASNRYKMAMVTRYGEADCDAYVC